MSKKELLNNHVYSQKFPLGDLGGHDITLLPCEDKALFHAFGTGLFS